MDISICPKEVFPNGSSNQGDYRHALEVYKRADFGIIELRKKEKIEYFEANSFKKWKVFTEVEGKNSFLWWLWAFVSKNVVFYLVDKTRSSNEVERMLRNPVVGRKNYYGNHSEFGGQFPAMMFTFCQSCIMNGINPDAYLAYYLNECARIGGVPENLERFLPHRLKKEGPGELMIDKND